VREVTEIGRYEVIEDIATYIDGYRLNAAVTLDATITHYESVSLLAMYLLKLMVSY
jgi:acetaldehyde dehydrogenase (acetylating)